jgi:hypothetical protein
LTFPEYPRDAPGNALTRSTAFAVVPAIGWTGLSEVFFVERGTASRRYEARTLLERVTINAHANQWRVASN